MAEDTKRVRLLCGNGIVGLADVAPRSIDHVITDPPYSKHTHQNGRAGAAGKQRNISRERDLGFDSISPQMAQDAARAFARVVRRWVLIFTDVENVSMWKAALTDAGLDYIRTGAWIKQGAAPQFTGDRPGMGFECIVIGHQPGKKAWNGGGRQGVWTFPIARGKERTGHTTQKPLTLMEALVRDFTNYGDLICDPFAGSGTTGVAARKLGRDFIGWEIQKKYADLARERILSTSEQSDLLRESRVLVRQSALFPEEKAS